MDEEYQYYDVPSGVMPWHAPAGFENPVPPARGDALPAGHQRSLFAGLRSRRADAADATSTLRWLIIVAVVALFVWFTVVPWIEEQIDRGNGLLDDIEQTIDDARESVEESNTDPGIDSSNRAVSTGKSPPDADGKSDLPGRYASLTYAELSNESEWANRQNIDSPYDGSVWGVSRASTAGASYIMLSHYTFEPPITDAAGREAFADSVADTLPDSEGADPKRRDITVDGREGFEYSYTQQSGTRTLVTYFLGDKHSYRFDCQAANGDDAFWAACVDAQETLKFRR